MLEILLVYEGSDYSLLLNRDNMENNAPSIALPSTRKTPISWTELRGRPSGAGALASGGKAENLGESGLFSLEIICLTRCGAHESEHHMKAGQDIYIANMTQDL